MDARTAKDLLVEQTAQQASLERVPLSDLEKRMMYFTEGPDAVEDTVKLNKEFKSKHNSEEYEKKVSLLLAHAYERIKNSNAQAAAEWDAAIDTLREGDHYLLVLLDRTPTSSAALGSILRLLVRLIALVSVTLGLLLGLSYLLKPLGISLASFLFFLFAAIVIAVALKPQSLGSYLKRAAMQIIIILDRTQEVQQLTVALPYFKPRSFSNSVSVRMVTPSSLALSYFDPGSVPTTA